MRQDWCEAAAANRSTCAQLSTVHTESRCGRKGFVSSAAARSGPPHVRMDKTGARWSLTGAEAVLVLRLRALWTNGDFDDYWAFHLEREHERTHRSRYAGGRVPYPLAPSTVTLRVLATALTTGGGGAGPAIFYRILTSREGDANFLSNAAKGLAPRLTEIANPLLHKGISVFDTLQGAASKVPVLTTPETACFDREGVI